MTYNNSDVGNGGFREVDESGGTNNSKDKADVRRDNQSSMESFTSFVYILSLIAIAAAFVALVSIGFKGGLVIIITLATVVGSFAHCLYLMKWIMAKDDSNAAMRKISTSIREGAESYLSVQYSAIAYIAVAVSIVLALIYLFREPPAEGMSSATLACMTALSFLMGSACSAAAGYIGVWVSVRCNIRCAIAASRFNYGDSLLIAFRGGAVAAELSAALCILGITILYLVCYMVFVNAYGLSPTHVPMLLGGYGFGASFVALFMQLGGGIYTKAADVGADMCGKIDMDIPEDDPRNPAVIADLVGDNVGDCAGSMADVFESIAAEVIGTMILGTTLANAAGVDAMNWTFFPLFVHALDLVISAVGIMVVKSASDLEDPLDSMKRGLAVCLVLAVTTFFATCWFMLWDENYPEAWWHYGLCGVVGNVCAYCLVIITQYYTDYKYEPVKRIVAASQTGHGTNVIAGVGVGMESTGLPICVISAGLLTSYWLGATSGLPGVQAGIFGTATATMGMLCTAVFVLSMNNFGPIADNAGGIVEMSGQPEQVRVITDRLDAVGNVTKAAAKGYAVGSSALACFVLFQAFLDEMSLVLGKPFDTINVAKVEVIVGGMMGIMMIFLFTGWAMAAVGKTAQEVVWEVRRQLKSRPGIMEGTELPDYGMCVSIVTKSALREMVKPAALALGAPCIIGFGFRFLGENTGRPMLGVEVAAGFLLFATLTGLLMAIFMDNSGGAWDNAKKLVEAQGGKGSDAHKAAVTGDTVGDPFKDTAGPALHVIITTMSTTILVLGPMFVGSNLEAVQNASAL